MKRFNHIKKTLIWASTILLLVGACALPIFTFANTAKADGLGTLQNNTQNQAIANVMSQCVDAVYQAQQAYLDGGYSMEDVQEYYYSSDGSRPFAGVDGYSVTTGYGTGQAITGLMTSSVTCNQFNTNDFTSDVLTSFAQSVGKSDTMDVICDGNNPGIMKLQYRDGNSWKDASGICRDQPDPNTEYRYVWNDRNAAESYLNRLYDGDWYSVGNFDKSQDYYRYYQEYRTTCVDPKNSSVVVTSSLDEVAPNINTSGLGPKIPWYRDDGTIEYHQYYQKDNTKSFWMSSLSTGLGGASSCDELAGMINGDGRGEDIDNRLAEARKEAQKQSCLNNIDDLNALTQTAQGIIDLDRHTPGTVPAEVVKNAQRVISRRFWEEDAKGEISCWIPDLSSGNATTKPPENVPSQPSDEPSPDGGSNSGTSNNGSNGGDSDSPIARCLDADSALTWVLCPTLHVVGTAAEAFYDSIEKDWLPVEANLLSTNEATYEVWGRFRDIANIVFAAVLLVVVFSQLTGLGISNYGIKKMLPNLIMVAVLVNLSFLICQVVVDLTNIIGAELGSMLNSIGNVPSEISGGVRAGRGIISALLNLVGIAGLGVAGFTIIQSALASGQLVAFLIPILIALVGALLGLFFFFLILAIRKAALIGAVILSPIAILCYALPNTKPLFDKWKKIFMALLVVYPMCQIVTGGGQMMAGIMLGVGNQSAMFYITALIMQIAPIFFIPSLVKGSLTALGNIGAKVSQLGDRWRSRATGAMRNSEIAKQAKIGRDYATATRKRPVSDFARKVNERLRNSARIGGAVRRIEDSAPIRGLSSSVGNASTRRRAMAQAAYLRNLRANQEAENIAGSMSDESIENKLAADRYKQQQELVDESLTAIQLGNGHYTDASGTEQTINATDMTAGGSMDRALDYYLSQYDATGDEKMLTQAEALTKLMFTAGGDKGRDTVLKRLEQRTFDADGNGTRTNSFTSLSQYINRDGKWMAELKNTDGAGFSMIGDGADANKHLENLNTYHIGKGISKMRPATTPDISDHQMSSIESGINDAINKISSNGRDWRTDTGADAQAVRNAIKSLSQTYTSTMRDQNLGGRVKDDALEHMNRVQAKAYEMELAAYRQSHPGGSEADFRRDTEMVRTLTRDMHRDNVLRVRVEPNQNPNP